MDNHAYPKIAEKNNIDFHPCGFHIIMNERKDVWKKQRSLNRSINSNISKIKDNEKTIAKYNKDYKDKHGRIPLEDTERRRKHNNKKKAEKENRTKRSENSQLRKQIDDYEDYNRRITEIMDADTLKEAKRRFNTLKNQIKTLPYEIAKCVRNLDKNLDNKLSHIENENIPKTNNLLESFIHYVLPKKHRNIFKTDTGIWNFIRFNTIRWYENVVFKERIEIEQTDIWTKLKNHTQKY